MPRLETKILVPAPNKRTRRGEEQLLAELEARVQHLKQRAAAKTVKRDPTLRYLQRAVRSIDAAASVTGDAALRSALEEARATLSACLQLQGSAPASREVGRAVEPDAVLAYLRSNPGQRSEHIAAALGTDSQALRRPMRELIASGRVRSKGERRATQYWAE